MSKRTYKSNEGGKSIALFTIGGVAVGWLIGRAMGPSCGAPSPSSLTPPQFDFNGFLRLTLNESTVKVPVGTSILFDNPDKTTWTGSGPVAADMTVLAPAVTAGQGAFVAASKGTTTVSGDWYSAGRHSGKVTVIVG